MKRSEMLNEIYRLLHCAPDYPTEDEILSRMEELGMLPPLAFHRYISGEHAWEPEDEITVQSE